MPSRSTLEEHAPTHLDELLDEVEYHNPELPDSAPFVVSEVRGRVHRRAIQVVTPARLIFELAIPVDGRLDLAMGIGDGAQVPVQFNVLVSPVDPRAADEYGSVVLDFTRRPGQRGWMQRSVDLSALGDILDRTHDLGVGLAGAAFDLGLLDDEALLAVRVGDLVVDRVRRAGAECSTPSAFDLLAIVRGNTLEVLGKAAYSGLLRQRHELEELVREGHLGHTLAFPVPHARDSLGVLQVRPLAGKIDTCALRT